MQTQAYETTNEGYVTDTSILQIRLNTDKLLDDIEKYLRGYIDFIKQDETGDITIEQKQFGEPKANSAGVQQLIALIRMLLSPAVVQGNLKRDEYYNLLADIHESLAVNMMNNLHKWGIKEEEYEAIIDNIMLPLIPFLSRLIDNKERESYALTLKSQEVIQQEKHKRWGI